MTRIGGYKNEFLKGPGLLTNSHKVWVWVGKGRINSQNKYQKSTMGLHQEHWAWFEVSFVTLEDPEKFFIFVSLSFFTSKMKRTKAIPEGWEEDEMTWPTWKLWTVPATKALNNVCKLYWWWSKGIWYKKGRNTNLNLRMMLITLEGRHSMCFPIWDGEDLSVQGPLPKSKPCTSLIPVTHLDLCNHSLSCLPTKGVLSWFFSALLWVTFQNHHVSPLQKGIQRYPIAVRIQTHYSCSTWGLSCLVIPQTSSLTSQPHGSSSPPSLQCPTWMKYPFCLTWSSRLNFPWKTPLSPVRIWCPSWELQWAHLS